MRAFVTVAIAIFVLLAVIGLGSSAWIVGSVVVHASPARFASEFVAALAVAAIPGFVGLFGLLGAGIMVALVDFHDASLRVAGQTLRAVPTHVGLSRSSHSMLRRSSEVVPTHGVRLWS